jgi:hypothetical protein
MSSLAIAIGNYEDTRSLGSRFRRYRAAHIMRLITKTVGEKGSCRIIDLGGVETYWNIITRSFLRESNCHITLLNLTREQVEDRLLFDSWVGEATAVDSPDGAFDIVHSNSVIEHVGDWRQMERFSSEVRRLAPRYFVQTPNFWFPWEPHYGMPLFQYLPKPVRISLLLWKRCGFFPQAADVSEAMAILESVRLLDSKMLQCLFPDAGIVRERFFGLTKSLLAIRDFTS